MGVEAHVFRVVFRSSGEEIVDPFGYRPHLRVP